MGIQQLMQKPVDLSENYRKKQAERRMKQEEYGREIREREEKRESRRQWNEAEYYRLVVAPREAERQERLRRDEEKRQAEEKEYERLRKEAWEKGVDLLTLTQGF